MSKQLLILFSIFLFGCNKPIIKSNRPRADLSNEKTLLHQARYSDLSVPVGFELISTKKYTHNTTKLKYSGNLSVYESTKFCKQSMESEGWEIQDFSTEDDGLLFCRKTTKACSVYLKKQTRNKTNINVVLKTQKKAETKKSKLPDLINNKSINNTTF